MTSHFVELTSSTIFLRFSVSLFKFSYWLKFNVNIITASGVMTILFTVWVLPNIWRLERVRDTKFDMNVSSESYWMLENARVTVFTFLVLIRETQQVGVKLPPTPPRLRLILQKSKGNDSQLFQPLASLVC